MARVLIYGAGAIGSIIGYLLGQTTEPDDRKIESVALLGRANHMQKIIQSGLAIEAPEGSQLLQFKYCFRNLDDLKESDFYPEFVIVCVKTYSLQRVGFELKVSGLLQGRLRNACFLLLMNGMGNKETFINETGLSSGRVLEGITSMGAKFSGDGFIELKGKGKTLIEDRICEKKVYEKIRQFLENGFRESGFGSN